jgi:hypothetical protein
MAHTTSIRICESIAIGGFLLILAVVIAPPVSSPQHTEPKHHERPILRPSRASSDGSVHFPLSDHQVRQVLHKYRLQWPASTSALLHFWRLRSLVADDCQAHKSRDPFTGTPVLVGQLRSVFLEYSTFRTCFPADGEWFLKRTGGLSLRQKTAFASNGELHPGQFLCILAECGILDDEPVITSEGSFTVRDIVSQAEHDYLPGDPAEFAAVAFALYLPPQRGFRNKLHESVTFDALMQSLTESPVGEGSCYGTHVCYAVATMLNVNETHPILSVPAAKCGLNYLNRIAQLLASTQHPDGAWRADWSVGKICDAPASATSSWGASIHVTGHHLEWLAITPARLLPSHSLHRAIDFLAGALKQATSSEIAAQYCPWSHAARSLLLWRETAVGKPLVIQSARDEGFSHGA